MEILRNDTLPQYNHRTAVFAIEEEAILFNAFKGYHLIICKNRKISNFVDALDSAKEF